MSRYAAYLASLSPRATRIRSARSLAFSSADSGITMIDSVAGNHRLDAPISISLVSAPQPPGSNASRCGWRPRHFGSLAAPAWPWASFIGRCCSQDSQRIIADAPLPAVRSIIFRTGNSAFAHFLPRWTHRS